MNCDDPILDCPKAGNGCGCRIQRARLERIRDMALRVNTPESRKYADGYAARIDRIESQKGTL